MEQLGTNCQAIKGHNLKFEFQKRRGEKNTSRIKIILKHKEKSCTKNPRLLLVKRSPKVHQNLKNGAITNQIQVWFIKQLKSTFLKVFTLSRWTSPYQCLCIFPKLQFFPILVHLRNYKKLHFFLTFSPTCKSRRQS